MMNESKAGYAVDGRQAMARLEEQVKRNGLASGHVSEIPDHLSVQGAINLLGNDARQLLEQLHELRSRLSPLLAERDTLSGRGPSAPVLSKMAAEIYDIHAVVQNARELVEITMLQLDI